jgi:long-chain acyl-CoA synthetase
VYPRGYRHERWSYRQLGDTARRFARELLARGIAKGDAVLLWSENCAEWAAAYWGCALCGVIAVPIDDGANPDFARRISTQVKTKLVICPRERAAAFEATPSIDPVNLVSAISRHPADQFRPVEIQPSDPLEIVFTSGTTAEPKGVVISHANVLAEYRAPRKGN